MTALIGAIQARWTEDAELTNLVGPPFFFRAERGTPLPFVQIFPVSGFQQQNDVVRIIEPVSFDFAILAATEMRATFTRAALRRLFDTLPLPLENGQSVAPHRWHSRRRVIMDSHYGDVIYLANQFQFSPYYAECTSANAAVAMLAERIATQSFIPKQSGPWITTIPPNATLPACRLHVTGATQGARSIGVQVSTFSQDDLEARALSAAIGEYLIRYDDREVMLTSDVGAFHVRSYGFQNKEGTEEVTAEGEVLYHAFVSYDLDWV